jgi:monofunctional glycosyltransferase
VDFFRRRPFLSVALIISLLLLGALGWFAYLWLTLPDVAFLADPKAAVELTVRDWKGGEHPFTVGPKNPEWTPLSAVPRHLVDALLAAEDINFYSHRGVDWQGVREAARRDWEKKRLTHGGSTLTQQLAKNLFLSRERTVTRKLREFLLARRLEKELGKQRILELYLNAVEFGPLVYGVGSAARHYFGIAPPALSLRQSALLVSMLPGPRVYDPYRKPERVKRATDRVLELMRDTRKITEEELQAALAAPDGLLSPGGEPAPPPTPEEEDEALGEAPPPAPAPEQPANSLTN